MLIRAYVLNRSNTVPQTKVLPESSVTIFQATKYTYTKQNDPRGSAGIECHYLSGYKIYLHQTELSARFRWNRVSLSFRLQNIPTPNRMIREVPLESSVTIFQATKYTYTKQNDPRGSAGIGKIFMLCHSNSYLCDEHKKIYYLYYDFSI